MESLSNRVDRLDMSVFDYIEPAGASDGDRRSLLALHAALATRGEFRYLEVGSYHGASLQSFVADSRCCSIVSIDRRDAVSPDERPWKIEYPDNTTERMLECLAGVPGADLKKLTTIEADTKDVAPEQLRADLCLIDAQHTNAAALQDARFCRHVLRDRGVIVFHDRLVVDRGIRRFLGELTRYRAYPVAHDLFVVELNVPSLLSDPRVAAQVPSAVWLAADRLGAVRLLMRLGPLARSLRPGVARVALTLGAPRRSRRRLTPQNRASGSLFEIHMFVTDDTLYQRSRRAYSAAGFGSGAFVRLSDADDDPFAAITRICRESTARYPILCHQDVFPDQGAVAEDLLTRLQELDAVDPAWVVAGNAGVMRSGRLIRRLVDGCGGSTGEPLPLPVLTLDENFLVLNARNGPRCTAGVSGFHLYGADVCLQALSGGGSAYVIDFPVTHLGNPGMTPDRRRAYWDVYERARRSFVQAWNDRCLFCYVITPVDTIFLSRSRILRQLFGSPRAVGSVAGLRDQLDGRPLRAADRVLAYRLRRTKGRVY
jgi:hypothetical protein